MKKTLFFAWLVLAAMLVSAAVHAEDANVEKEPKLSLEASLSGNDENPVLTVRLTNIGEVPVIVDKKLMFMLEIRSWCVGNDGIVGLLESLSTTDFSEVSELESRLVPLKPGEKMERQVRLREGYEQFSVAQRFIPDGPDSEQKPLFRIFRRRWQMHEDTRLKGIEIFYTTSDYFVDYVAEYVKNVNAAQLYPGKIRLSVTVPYEFTEAADGGEETE